MISICIVVMSGQRGSLNRQGPSVRECLWCLANGLPLRYELDEAWLSRVLFHVQGCRDRRFRTVPSAGATYPLEVYVSSLGRIFPLKTGLYKYVSCSGNLVQSSVNADFEGFLFSVLPGRTVTYYGERGYMYVRNEVGHALQNLFLSLVSHGLWGSVRLVELEFGPGKPQYIAARVDVARVDSHCRGFSLEKGLPFDTTVVLRRSIRNYSREAISSESLLDVLKWSMGEIVAGSRPYLKFGEEYGVNGSVAVFNVRGLDKGIYEFNAKDMELELVRTGDFREKLWRASLMQESVRRATAVIVLFGDGLLGEVEAGAVGQNIYLNAVDEGLGTVAIGAFHEEDFLEVFGEQRPLYVFPLGKPAE